MTIRANGNGKLTPSNILSTEFRSAWVRDSGPVRGNVWIHLGASFAPGQTMPDEGIRTVLSQAEAAPVYRTGGCSGHFVREAGRDHRSVVDVVNAIAYSKEADIFVARSVAVGRRRNNGVCRCNCCRQTSNQRQLMLQRVRYSDDSPEPFSLVGWGSILANSCRFR